MATSTQERDQRNSTTPGLSTTPTVTCRLKQLLPQGRQRLPNSRPSGANRNLRRRSTRANSNLVADGRRSPRCLLPRWTPRHCPPT